MTNSPTKTCQNCQVQFTIEPEDFDFYEKIKVPPPTWCPECRMKRRMLFRNEFNMHKCQCALCGKGTISHYSSKVSFPIYCSECWWSDKWDPLDFGQVYDPNKNFFLQWKELSDKVPRPNLEAYQNYNSPYSDYTWFSKNIYLSPSTLNSDTVAYSKSVWDCRDTFDSTVVVNCESVYETLNSERCVSCQFMSDSKDCLDSAYLFDCRNSSNCFMSSNLRNKRFVFRNQQLREAEYREKLNTISRDYETQKKLYSDYILMREKALHKYANIIKCTNSSGNNLTHCKNAQYCFNAENCEDVKYGVQMRHVKDVQDVYGVGDKEASLLYDGVNVGYLDSNIYFSLNTFENCARIQYCDYCRVSQDLFGCVSLRKKQYCILNKQYSQGEYLKLQEKIIRDMSDNPYINSRGNIYKYGEFFPIEFSFFAYNEAMTQFYFPSKKEEVISFGYAWMEPEARNYQITKITSEIPGLIEAIDDSILKEVIKCEHEQKCEHNCTLALKITSQELLFYRKMKIPIPRLCPGCRNGERGILRNPLKLWHRSCQCSGEKSSNGVYPNTIQHAHGNNACPNAFETSYAPERPEIVYCEQCYQAEVV